jgi:hypothetical protein
LPQVPIYEAPDREVAIPDRGVEALGSAARRLGTLGVEKAQLINKGAQDIQQGFERLGSGVDQLADFQKTHETTQEMVNGGETFAATNSALTQQWQKLTSDPNNLKNPNLAQDFLENNVRPAVEDAQTSFQTPEGQRWAAAHGNDILTHWGSIASSDQARLAGINAVASTNQTLDHLTNAVNTDPAQLPLALTQLKSQNAALVASGNLPTDQSARTVGPGQDEQVSQLIQVAGKSQIDANPNADMSGFYKSYGDRLGGEKVATLQNYQLVRQKLAVEQQRADQTEQTRIQTEAFNQSMNGVVGSMFQRDGTLAVPQDYYRNLAQAATLPGANTDKITQAMKLGQSITDRQAAGKDTATDPITQRAFGDRIYNSTDPLTVDEVDKAYINGRLSNHDYTSYRGWAQNAEKQQNPAQNELIQSNQQIAKNAFMPKDASGLTGGQSWGPTAYAMFQQQFNQGVAQARANGTLQTDYLNPSSKSYWGNTINLSNIATAAKNTAPPDLSGAAGGNGLVAPPGTANAPASKGKAPLSSFFGFGSKQ